MQENLKDKIKETREKLQNHAVAKKILDLMKELRSEANEFTERRWIWELIQNAQDVAQDDGISITIDLNIEDKILKFSHTGKAFSIDNIVGLIEQIGTKERNIIEGSEKKTVGKFGTGFLTTHLLSEKVEVNSYLEEPTKNFINFNLILDRSGDSLDKISAAVDISIKVLENLNKTTPVSFIDNISTNFKYYLSEEGIHTAKIGVDDLILSLPYTLTFINKINEVKVNHESIVFNIGEVTLINENISDVIIQKKHILSGLSENIYFLVASSDQVDIAIPYTFDGDKKLFTGVEKKTPKIFCEFPLIGTEDFYLPFVINSSRLNPTKDRNGIALTDKNDILVHENKEVIRTAVKLYMQVLNFISTTAEWNNRYHLASIEECNENLLLSAAWYGENVLKPIRNKILRSKLINTVNEGLTSILLPDDSKVDLLYHKDNGVLEQFWELCNYSDNFILPIKEEVQYWKGIKWLTDYFFTIEKFITWVSQQKKITNLASIFNKPEEDIITWLNKIIEFLHKENFASILAEKSIIPNQNGVFVTKDILYAESDPINNELKDLVKELGIDIRNELLHEGIILNIPSNRSRSSKFLATEIERLIEPRLAQIPRSPSTKNIARRILQWFNNNSTSAQKLFSYLYKDRHILRDDSEIIADMKKADILDRLVQKSGCSQDEIEQLAASNDTITIKIASELYPDSEDELEQSLALTDNSDERSRVSISEEAKEQIIIKLKELGFLVPDTIRMKFTIMDGVINPSGLPTKIVVKSAKGSKIYFNPSEWMALAEIDAQLFIVTKGNVVRNITLTDLESVNDTFHMRFNTEAFAIQTNLKAFASFFHYLPYTHFIFDAPESTTDFLEYFGLNNRNHSVIDLSEDDEKLLH